MTILKHEISGGVKRKREIQLDDFDNLARVHFPSLSEREKNAHRKKRTLPYATALVRAFADLWKSSRSSFFRIFPAADLGMESTNWKI